MTKPDNRFLTSLDLSYVLHRCNAKNSLYNSMSIVVYTYQYYIHTGLLSENIEPKRVAKVLSTLKIRPQDFFQGFFYVILIRRNLF